jgi:hypothetical protein
VPMAGAPGSTGRVWKGLKRRAWKGGWNNWRKNYEPRLTDGKRCGGFASPSALTHEFCYPCGAVAS